MTVTYVLILIPFGLILLGWAIFSIVCIVKMLRFGFLSRQAVMSTFVYVAFVTVVILVGALNLRGVDWTTPYTFTVPGISLPSVQSNLPKTFSQ